MPVTLCYGTFRPSFGTPDGDSQRFVPDDVAVLRNLRLRARGVPLSVNSRNGSINMRYEGIDTMEKGAAEPYVSAATQANLTKCGVADGTGSARGFILTNQVDGNGRPICFVFPASATGHQDIAGKPDGASIFMDVSLFKHSVNYHLVVGGYAYPLFYNTLFDDVRDELCAAAIAARSKRMGVWNADATTTGTAHWGRWQGWVDYRLSVLPPLMPKLWRRLEAYARSRDNDGNNLDDFLDYLRDRPEDITVITSGERRHFHDIVRVTGLDQVMLQYQAWEIEFDA